MESGEEERIEIPFDSRSFRYFNVLTNVRKIEGGVYEIGICVSCRNIQLSAKLELLGAYAPNTYAGRALPSYFFRQGFKAFRRRSLGLLGKMLPDYAWPQELDRQSMLGQMEHANILQV